MRKFAGPLFVLIFCSLISVGGRAQSGPSIFINEFHYDNASTDTGEFIEIAGPAGTNLSGYSIVLYNGASPGAAVAYNTRALSGVIPDQQNGFGTVSFNYPVDGIQNGSNDGIALVQGSTVLQLLSYEGRFTVSTGLSNSGPAAGMTSTDIGVSEPGTTPIGQSLRLTGAGTSYSDFTWAAPAANSAGLVNDGQTFGDVPPPPPPSNSVIVISQIYGAGGNSSALYQNDYVELYNRGSVTVDTLGWTLQYASATGNGWNFTKAPLGGPIAPGERYLVKLGSGGAVGASLPDANASGLFNISATDGKIAIVDNFDGLVGNCPTANPHVKDFVGYGSADCAEGALPATAPSASKALFRKSGGDTDTDRNNPDFELATANARRTAPIVELPPLVMGIDGSNGGVNFNIPRDPTFSITFTEPVTADDGWFDITCGVTGQHNDHTSPGHSGRILDITPNVNLQAGESCTLSLFKDRIHDQDNVDAVYDTLLADLSWPFTVSSGSAPPYPPSVHLTFGNPSGATSDVDHFDNYLMEKPEYALSYNRDQGRPNWVSWHLSFDWYGSLPRIDTFRADPQVPPDWYRVQGFDFSGSGFDRGHMVPNADRDKETSVPINQATYLMTNMVAQSPDNNQGPWADLENYLRTLTNPGPAPAFAPGNDLYIVAGPQGTGGQGTNGNATTIADGHVTVPQFTWKAVLVVPPGNGDALSRVDCSTRTIGVIMPNIQGIRNVDWTTYLASIDQIEALTGYDLFSNLPPRVEYCVEAGINGTNPPEDLTPPAIHCDEPDGVWHDDNVTLTCTAADTESGLASASDASFTLGTLVVGDTEDGNASTDMRTVCDVVGNCATAGPIAGNKIDRKNPVASIATPVDGAVYPLNSIVNAAYSCVDGGSGVATCTGDVPVGSPIDTASSGPKIFAVTAIDGVGNASTVAVSYTVSTGPAHKRNPSISINNIPESAVHGGSFTPAFTYDGDGIIHLQSMTPSVCKIQGDRFVNFVGAGTCTIVASATPTGSVNAAAGALQSFPVLP